MEARNKDDNKALDNNIAPIEPQKSKYELIVRDDYQRQLKGVEKEKYMMTKALEDTSSFLPSILFDTFPALPKDYKPIFNSAYPDEDFNCDDTEEKINTAILALSKTLIHSLIWYNDKWMFITEVQASYMKNTVKNLAKLKIFAEKFQEKDEVWYEVHCNYEKINMIVTGGFYNDDGKLASFSGFAVPHEVDSCGDYILFSPIMPAETTLTSKKSGSYKERKWHFKSSFFANYA